VCLAALTVNAGPGAATNASPTAEASPQEPVIPRSTFEAPKNSKEGRDPFFPNSTRVFGTVEAKTNAGPMAVNLFLKALSGTVAQRLATINNATFAAGEVNDVIAGTTRVRVHVIEIKEDSVLIEVGGVRRTLRMRSGF
jgi:hypothetical protein